MTTTTIKPEDVKRLREQTGAGVMDCKRALEESGGDLEQATHWLREKGLSAAAKKADREVREGVIASYIHHGARLGSMVELNCETDFVARTDDFKNLARDVAIAVAGHDTVQYVSRNDVPSEVLDGKRQAFAAEARDEGRPADRVAEIAEGKLTKWLEAACLMDLQYRDTDRKISDLVTEKIALLGENIRIARFVRMAVGEDSAGRSRSTSETS